MTINFADELIKLEKAYNAKQNLSEDDYLTFELDEDEYEGAIEDVWHAARLHFTEVIVPEAKNYIDTISQRWAQERNTENKNNQIGKILTIEERDLLLQQIKDFKRIALVSYARLGIVCGLDRHYIRQIITGKIKNPGSGNVLKISKAIAELTDTKEDIK